MAAGVGGRRTVVGRARLPDGDACAEDAARLPRASSEWAAEDMPRSTLDARSRSSVVRTLELVDVKRRCALETGPAKQPGRARFVASNARYTYDGRTSRQTKSRRARMGAPAKGGGEARESWLPASGNLRSFKGSVARPYPTNEDVPERYKPIVRPLHPSTDFPGSSYGF
jgi:hypothetical protein